MKRFLTAVLIAGTAALLSVSTAAAYTFDAFGDSQGSSLSPLTYANSGFDSGATPYIPVTAANTDIPNLRRSLDVTWISGTGAVRAYVDAGHYDFAADPSVNSTGVINWKVNDGISDVTADLSAWSGLGIMIAIIFQDLITPPAVANPTMQFSLTDSTGTTISKAFTLSATAPPTQFYFGGFGSFIMTAPGSDGDFDWNAFSSARLFLDASSTAGLDVTIDIINTPEPGTLVLLGLGLAACSAAAYRRRKGA